MKSEAVAKTQLEPDRGPGHTLKHAYKRLRTQSIVAMSRSLEKSLRGNLSGTGRISAVEDHMTGAEESGPRAASRPDSGRSKFGFWAFLCVSVIDRLGLEHSHSSLKRDEAGISE